MSNAPANLFFDTPEKRAALEAEALSWLGTPFVPKASIKGAGCDCVGLLKGVFVNLGICADFRMPDYPCTPTGMETSVLLDELNKRPFLVRTQPPGAPGCILVFEIDGILHHTGLLIGPRQFILARKKRGATRQTLDDVTYSKRLRWVYWPVITENLKLKSSD